MRQRLILLPLALLAAASVAASPVTVEGGHEDPWPLGVCAHIPSLHSRPICVLVDPTE